MILCENAVSVFFVKAQVARKRVILHKSFFFLQKSCLGKCWELMAMFYLLNFITNIGLLRNGKCKLTFGLSIYLRYLSSYDFEEHRSGIC